MQHEYQLPKSEIDLNVISTSGQCFRMYRLQKLFSDPVYDVLAVDKFLRVRDTTDCYTFTCDESESKFWFEYFDMGTDYSQFHAAIRQVDDNFLNSALVFSQGMRILRQDYWETVVSFLISQNNNIPRIQSIIKQFCNRFGKHLEDDYYAFPSRESLKGITVNDLQSLGLGYRDKYIEKVCNASDEELKPDFLSLQQLSGIGPKVASCIMLYGMHQMNQCPIDVWMKRIIDNVYAGKFDWSKYSGFEGFVQQIMFYYYRSIVK